MTIWEILGIPPTSDPLKIRRAYAKQSKEHHLESDPEGFRILYEAYQTALAESKRQSRRPMIRSHVLAALSHQSSEKETAKLKIEEHAEPESEFDFGELMRRFQQNEAEEKRQYEREGALHELILLFTDPEKSKEEKVWKDYFTSNTFLNAQYDLKYIRYLTEYLREQRLVETSKLMRPLFYNLCIVYGLFVGQDPIFHAETLNDLLCLLNNHEKRTEYLKSLFTKKEYQQEIEAWHLYRSFLELNSTESRTNTEAWKRLLRVLNREFNPATNRKRSKIFYFLLAHLLRSMTDMTPEIYKAFYDWLSIDGVDGNQKKRLARPVADALKEIENEELFTLVRAEKERQNEIRLFISDFERLYKKAKETELMPQELDEVFRGKRMESLKFTREMLQRLQDYFKNRLDVPYSVWKAVYTIYQGKKKAEKLLGFMAYGRYQIYVKRFKNERIAGEQRYLEEKALEEGEDLKNGTFDSQMCLPETEILESRRQLPGMEIQDRKEREQWIAETIFYNGLTIIWKSATKGSMRTVYRERLSGILWAAAAQSDYTEDQLRDGILKIFWGDQTVSFYHSQEDKRVTVSWEDFYAWMLEMTDLYLKRYFCTLSEKKAFEDARKALREVIYP